MPMKADPGAHLPAYIQSSAEGALLTVHVQPHASRTEFAGRHGDALKVRVAAPPVDGAANDALCRFLAGRLGLPKGGVEVRSGSGGRRKRILLRGISARQVSEALDPQKAARA